MSCSRKSIPRVLAATSTTALTLICMLALAPTASARVTVVPGSVRGGSTGTFAVRLTNEQPDRWSEPALPGWPGAPMIAVTPDPDAVRADGSAPVEAGSHPVAAAVAEPTARGARVLPWVLLVVGVLVAGIGSLVGYRQQEERRRAERRRRLVRSAIEKLPAGVGRR